MRKFSQDIPPYMCVCVCEIAKKLEEMICELEEKQKGNVNYRLATDRNYL